VSRLNVALGVLAAAAAVGGAAWMVVGQGRRGGEAAEAWARQALSGVGQVAVGAAAVTPEGEHERAWALERARPGRAGQALATGEGGAYRWRVVFQGGGEARFTDGGLLWSLRRPLPTDPGPDLYRPHAGEHLTAALAKLVPDPAGWRLEDLQTWEEEGCVWYRGWFVGDSGGLPRGWRREAEVEVAGSTTIAFARHVQPLGIDIGVVEGRTGELAVLRLPALVGLGLIVMAMLVTGVGAVVMHRPVAWVLGGSWALVLAGLGVLSGSAVAGWGGAALAIGAVMALLPAELRGDGRGGARCALAGVALAALALGGRWVAVGAGAFLPQTPALPGDVSPWALLPAAWVPALTEEPVLRGVLPALARPVLGWWGAALLSVPVGALLHPLPAVPLVAALALEAVVQLALVVVARHGGVVGAVAARGVLESILRRPAYPLGWPWDAVAAAGVIGGAAWLVARARR
jgi:hypothetical protein